MRVMLIGGAGLVGSYLARHLREEGGHQIVTIDGNERPLLDHYGVKQLSHIDSYSQAYDAIKLHRPEVIVFLAAAIGKPSAVFAPLHGLIGSYHAANDLGVKRFVYLSKVQQQGHAAACRLMMHEPLDTMHAMAELFLTSTPTKLDLCILKATTIYAPDTRGKLHNLLNSLITHAIEDKPIFLSTRKHEDFVFIGDVIKALRGVVEQGMPKRACYISSGSEARSHAEIGSIFNHVADDLGFPKVKLTLAPPSLEDEVTTMSYEESDSNRLMLQTGIDEQPISLAQGFRKLIAWELSMRSIDNADLNELLSRATAAAMKWQSNDL